MDKDKIHSFVVDEDISDIRSKTDAKGILSDIKYLIKEYYIGNFSETADALVIQLTNGQAFEICVREIVGPAN